MHTTTPTRSVATAALLAALASPALADEGDANPAAAPITASATLDYVSQYMFRGYEQLDSDQGPTIQPGIEFTLPVDEGVGLTIGTWGSIHTDTDGPPGPGASSNPSSWYEQDIYGALGFSIGDFGVSTGLIYYTYPSSAVNGNVTEFVLEVSYDDSELLGDFAFSPYVLFALELQNNLLSDENAYLEIGGEFAFDMDEHYGYPLVWTVPVALGLSLDAYYTDNITGNNETFGYASVGLFATVPLSELLNYDKWMGAWDLTGGVTFYLLNNDVALTDNFSGHGDNYQFVATVGIAREW